MMKHTKHLLVLWAALLLGAGNAWGATFTITFKQNANDGSAALTASSFSEQVTAGSSYISSVSNLSKVYAGKSGIKLGSSSAIGAFSITFNQAYKITNVSISAVKYGSDTGKIKCGVSSTSTTTSTVSLSSTATECPFTFNGSEISTIYIATSAKRAYIASITVTYETGTPSTTVYLGLFLAAFVAVRACVRRVECLYATFHHIIMSKIDFRSVHFAKECFVRFFCFCCSFLLLDQKKRTKEKSRLWRLRCQKFVVSVSAKSNSLRSDSDLAFRHAQLDF